MKHSFVPVTAAGLFSIILSINILITFFIKDYAEIGIYFCFRICTVYEKFIIFLKTTRKYALLSTPIENRAATRMKR